MKKFLIVIAALISTNVFANRILWVGMGNNPMVDVNGNAVSLATWISTLPCDPADVGGRIRIGNTALPAGYEAVPGDRDSTVFDDDITEFELAVTDQSGNFHGWMDWGPIKLTDIADSDPLNVEIFFDLGYWDESADWDFVAVATASAYVDTAFWNAHSYESGTLAPPTETPWRPFAAVPEPSSCLLGLLGCSLLFISKRRQK